MGHKDYKDLIHSVSSLKRQPWFRFHLTTLILFSLLSAILVWENTKPHQVNIPEGYPFDLQQTNHGWPFYSWLSSNKTLDPGGKVQVNPEDWVDKAFIVHRPTAWIANILVGTGILSAMTIIFEVTIRRLKRNPEGVCNLCGPTDPSAKNEDENP